MAAKIENSTLKFLKDLKANNDKDWFASNKGRYDEAKANFEEFIAELINNIAKFDEPIGELVAKKTIFRIYRDVRFSKDKAPYKINMGAHLSVNRSKVHDRAGYYIQIQPGNSFLAGGAYDPGNPWITQIRKEIDYNTKEFKKLINSASFKKYFGEIEGDKLKTAPKGFPKDHPEMDLLQYKSYLAVNRFDDKMVTSADFMKHCTNVFKAMKPFDDFLNRAAD
ncbi:MAG: DUF2461 domain-containing protein [Chitinophagales bacterium]|nr:DUF2461 domain-containing protein [Chitinophagaceae bacterium]MCB9065902.1 DUF2461 domain-containing protein [Chitinophagales bacterium]